MRRFSLFPLLLATASAAAQPSDWQRLLAADSLEAAVSVCATRTTAPAAAVRADAHVCLANVEVRRADEVIALSNGPGGGVIGPRFVGDGVDRALAHIDTARAATPGDVTLYQGQLHLLTRSAQFDRAPAVLRAALAHTSAPLDTWHAYVGDFYSAGAIDEGIAYLQLLHEAAPDAPSVLADLGGFLVVAERDAEAEPLLVRAVALAPDDPVNLWNLGRFRFYSGVLAEAEALYRRAIEADPAWAEANRAHCLLADLLAERTEGSKEAASLRTAYGCRR